MPILFDGPTKIITLASATTSVLVATIYSRWKDWVKLTDNAKFLPAFREVGGDPLGGGVQSGINIFLRNDLGWRIRPPEENIVITITGNLFGEDPDLPQIIPTIGGFDTVARLSLSANLLQLNTAAQVASAVWEEATATHVSGTTFGGAAQAVVYTAKVMMFDDDVGTTDRYVVSWFANGAVITSGITAAQIRVVNIADGIDLIAPTAMTQIATLGRYRHSAVGAARIVAGSGYLIIVSATIAGATRTWDQPIGRDS